tara:strand:- start:515 stop:994 length:480 start_codon:yes stop_codon:yes gene_type:complete
MMSFLFSLCLLFNQHYDLSSTQKVNICKYESEIKNQAKINNIDPTLLASVMFVESSFYPHVVSSANACGLTQVIPKWTGGKETKGKKYTCNQLKNPDTAIEAGARILSYSIKVYGKGNVDRGLCIYNAGMKCVTKKDFYKRLYYVKKVRQVYSIITGGS